VNGQPTYGPIVVFAGPSIELAAAQDILDARYLPPVVRGDIDVLLRRPVLPRAIAVIDGKFLQSLAISPKEILRAVDAGVAVYGSSSMGALRAAECHPWGMIGVGRVFEAFRDGVVDADDEVAMVYDDEDRPLSEPLINMRLALTAGVSAGLVDPEHARVFLDAARAVYFPHRSVRSVLRALGDALTESERARLAAFLTSRDHDVKRADAYALLRRIRDDALLALPQSGAVPHDRTDGDGTCPVGHQRPAHLLPGEPTDRRGPGGTVTRGLADRRR
jgi:TfuA protein